MGGALTVPERRESCGTAARTNPFTELLKNERYGVLLHSYGVHAITMRDIGPDSTLGPEDEELGHYTLSIINDKNNAVIGSVNVNFEDSDVVGGLYIDHVNRMMGGVLVGRLGKVLVVSVLLAAKLCGIEYVGLCSVHPFYESPYPFCLYEELGFYKSPRALVAYHSDMCIDMHNDLRGTTFGDLEEHLRDREPAAGLCSVWRDSDLHLTGKKFVDRADELIAVTQRRIGGRRYLNEDEERDAITTAWEEVFANPVMRRVAAPPAKRPRDAGARE